MKNVLILMLVIVWAAFGQFSVKTVPSNHDWIKLYDEDTGYLLVGDGGDGIDTSLAFSPKQWEGVATLALKSDTTGVTVKAAGQSDSCLIIFIQFKNNNTGWGSYQNDNDTYKALSSLSKLDTLDRAYADVGGTVYRYFDLANYTEWLWADSIRFLFGIGYADSLKLYPEVGGQ